MTSGTARAPDRTARDLLIRLLELTPPPPLEATVEQLLMMFEAVVANRAAILETIVPPLRLAPPDRFLLDDLEARHATWQEALESAKRYVAKQHSGAAHMRAYADHL